MRNRRGTFAGQGAVAARFQSGADVVGQEAWEGVHLGHDQKPTGAEHGADLGEDAIGFRHVVQRRRRPDKVDGAERRPHSVQVRHDGVDPVGHTEGAGCALQTVQQELGHVGRDHLGGLEALEQGEGSCVWRNAVISTA